MYDGATAAPTVYFKVVSEPSINSLKSHARSPLPLGHSVGGMRILAVLGAGRFGMAYLAAAADPKSGEQRHVVLREYMPAGLATRRSDSYAVRALRASDRPDFDWGLARLRQEAEALAALDHPNLARSLGLIEENGTAYRIEEYVDGQSLDSILERRGKLPEAEIRFLLAPLLDGLEQIHRVGLVHGGIEPAQILFRPGGIPVLVGFGAPRPTPSARGADTEASWSAYAPHEIQDSRASVGPWTDIYALGAVLYRAVSGVAPSPGAARIAALDRGEPDPQGTARGLPGYGPGLLAAIDKALALAERERPQSLAAFRAVLSRAPDSASEAAPRRKAAEPQLFDVEAAKISPPSGTREIAPMHQVRGLRRRAPLPDSPPPLAGPVPGAPPVPAAPAAPPAGRRPPPGRSMPRTWIWIAAFGAVIAAAMLGWRQYEAGTRHAAAPAAPDAHRADEQRRAARQRQAEEAQKAESARRADEARKADEARRAEDARQAEAARQAEQARRADEARRAEAERRAEEARRRAEAERAERAAAALREAIPKIEAALAGQDWAGARTLLADAESLAPNHAKLSDLRGALVAETARRVARADEAAQRREWAAAEKLLDEAAAVLPGSDIVTAGRARIERARRAWELGRVALERRADLLIDEGVAAARKFDFSGASNKLGEAEQALEGFAADHPLRARLAGAVAEVQRLLDDVEYERHRVADYDAYLANRARADALFDLAQKELHEKKNAVRACVLYRESGGLGHVGAQNQLGLCFASGQGMPKDEVEAYNWFRRAAEGGNAIGQYNLAQAFATGNGIARHYESAVHWARKSAEQGYPKGLCRLGLFYRDGEGVAADAAEAARLFRQGADKGDEWCMALLAEAYEKGAGIAKNARQARLWYERAAAKGYEPAKAWLKAPR
jgi:TPR repeat protein/serine/threonine protein kinase